MKSNTKTTTAPTLRAAQVRVLAALATTGAPLTRKQIAEAAKCDLAGLTEHIGSSDPATRKANDQKWFPSLLSRKLVTAKDGNGGTIYALTAKGRKVAEKVAAK